MATKQAQEAEKTRILQIIFTRPDTTTRHLSSVLEMPYRRVQRRLAQLEQDGLVWKAHRGKTVVWRDTIPF